MKSVKFYFSLLIAAVMFVMPVQAQENQPACDQIMDVIRKVAETVNGAYIETSDLRSNDQKTGDGDTIHFCREDLQELGYRYFDAYMNLKA